MGRHTLGILLIVGAFVCVWIVGAVGCSPKEGASPKKESFFDSLSKIADSITGSKPKPSIVLPTAEPGPFKFNLVKKDIPTGMTVGHSSMRYVDLTKFGVLPAQSVVGDFDGDGAQDVLFFETDGTVNLLFGNQGADGRELGAMTSKEHLKTANGKEISFTNGWFQHAEEFVAGNFDADSPGDEIAVFNLDGTIEVHKTGTETKSFWELISATPTPYTAEAGWFTGYSRRMAGRFVPGQSAEQIVLFSDSGDVLLLGLDATSKKVVTLAQFNTPGQPYPAAHGWFGRPQLKLIADVNGDGFDEIVFLFNDLAVHVWKVTVDTSKQPLTASAEKFLDFGTPYRFQLNPAGPGTCSDNLTGGWHHPDCSPIVVVGNFDRKPGDEFAFVGKDCSPTTCPGFTINEAHISVFHFDFAAEKPAIISTPADKTLALPYTKFTNVTLFPLGDVPPGSETYPVTAAMWQYFAGRFGTLAVDVNGDGVHEIVVLKPKDFVPYTQPADQTFDPKSITDIPITLDVWSTL
jgi:hypothetical protein